MRTVRKTHSGSQHVVYVTDFTLLDLLAECALLKGDHNDAQTISGGGHRVRSSTSRLPKHRVVPADVCDAQYPVLRPSYGPDIDVTVAVSPPRASRLSRRSLWSNANGRSSLEVRRPTGCLSTVWYQPTCVMLNTRYSGRLTFPILIVTGRLPDPVPSRRRKGRRAGYVA
jgi:hypothetical protein